MQLDEYKSVVDYKIRVNHHELQGLGKPVGTRKALHESLDLISNPT